jgi:hypothetical protein
MKPSYLLQTLAAVLISLLCLAPGSVSAEIIAKCGSSYGHVGETGNGLMQKMRGRPGEISEDSFSPGKITLEANTDDAGETVFDIVFETQLGAFRASKSGVVKTMYMNSELGTLVLVVITRDNLRSYIFNMDQTVQREVVWTDTQYGSAPRARLMMAKCE